MRTTCNTDVDPGASPFTAPGVQVNMRREEARALRDEMEDLVQAFPSSLLEGASPFAQIYRELTRVLGR